jgi:hypothetical protein
MHLAIADRFSPSSFSYGALLGAAFNVIMIWNGNTLPSMLVILISNRFFLLESRRNENCRRLLRQGLGKISWFF